MIDAVVTHHRDRFRSGVVRFNEELSTRLAVPLLGLDGIPGTSRMPLLSFKVGEFAPADVEQVERALADPSFAWKLFLHEYAGLPLERRLIEGAAAVHCGNEEIAGRVRALGANVDALWSPATLADRREFPVSDISVFSFGMAHKLRIEMFQRLAQLLEQSGRTYVVYASAANHETASLRDTEVVFQEMHALFPEDLYFLGNLSDVAVWHYLGSCTFYAAFFTGGVRANNSTVVSAMERGAVIVTNLDAHSPPDLVHMHNVIDIGQCAELPLDPAVLQRLSENARAAAAARSWDSLIERIR